MTISAEEYEDFLSQSLGRVQGTYRECLQWQNTDIDLTISLGRHLKNYIYAHTHTKTQFSHIYIAYFHEKK